MKKNYAPIENIRTSAIADDSWFTSQLKEATHNELESEEIIIEIILEGNCDNVKAMAAHGSNLRNKIHCDMSCNSVSEQQLEHPAEKSCFTPPTKGKTLTQFSPCRGDRSIPLQRREKSVSTVDDACSHTSNRDCGGIGGGIMRERPSQGDCILQASGMLVDNSLRNSLLLTAIQNSSNYPITKNKLPPAKVSSPAKAPPPEKVSPPAKAPPPEKVSLHPHPTSKVSVCEPHQRITNKNCEGIKMP